jgi:pyruvate formate lyase activating enzyme
MLKEATYYEKLENGKVKCVLCPKNCVILPSKRGVCGVRQNLDGKLYALVYEKPIAVHIDPIEKKPLYHFHPSSKILSIGTYGCNLKCKFCQNYDISQEFEVDNIYDLETLQPEEIISFCKSRGLNHVAFTYNEPTIFYEYMLDVAKLCKINDIYTVVVSNGQINEDPLKELIVYIDAFNIDLKAFNNKFYKEICKGDIETTKHTIEFIVKYKKHIEVTFLLIEGYNDNLVEFQEMCKYLSSLNKNIVLHISRAFPRYKMNFKITPYSLMKEFGEMAKIYLNYVYLGNI